MKTDVSVAALSLSLKDQNVELWLAESSCGFRNCQYFIVQKRAQKIAQKKGSKDSAISYSVLGEFFGGFKVLESSHKGYRDIEVRTKSAEASGYTLVFNGKLYDRK